jgi:hypothetical protein
VNVFVIGGKDRLREFDVRRDVAAAGFEVFHAPKHAADKVYDAIDAFVLVFPTDKMGRALAGWFMGRWQRRGYKDRRGVFFLSEREIKNGEAPPENVPGGPERNFFCKTIDEVFDALRRDLPEAPESP